MIINYKEYFKKSRSLTKHKKHLDSIHDPQHPQKDNIKPIAPIAKNSVSALRVMFSGSKEEYP